MDIALATCSAMPGLTADDRYLLAALRRHGLAADPMVWEDPLAEWNTTKLCVIRSCWDYAWRYEPFLTWVDATARETTLYNAAATIRWNGHKGYLLDLAARDVPTVPTVVLPAGEPVRLRTLLVEREWHDAVVKAAVGNSGRYARRVTLKTVGREQRYLDRLLGQEDALLQPLVRSVAAQGELSLVFVDGAFTHAVRKRAPGGEFRVHDDYGGTVEPEDPHPTALAAAEAAIAAVGEDTLYGRVDLVEGPDGEPWVMELELIEPELFFRFSGDAVDRMAGAIAARVA